MTIELHIAETLYNTIDNNLSGTIATGTSLIMIGLGGLFGTIWLIERTVRSIGWSLQGFNGIMKDEVMNFIKSVFIIYSAFHVDWYLQVVVPFVNDMPTWTMQQLSHNTAGNNQVDTLINSYLNGVWAFISNFKFDPIWNFRESLSGVLALLAIIIGGVPFLGLTIATLMTLKVTSAILLVLGPLFIAFALFDQTRQYFWGWVSVLGGIMLTQILFGVVITLEINFLNAFVMTKGDDGFFSSTFEGAFALLFYFGTFTAIATELPNYAASIMGGAPSGTHGLKKLMLKGTGIGTALRFGNAIKPS